MLLHTILCFVSANNYYAHTYVYIIIHMKTIETLQVNLIKHYNVVHIQLHKGSLCKSRVILACASSD